jgi:hypothetical protein
MKWGMVGFLAALVPWTVMFLGFLGVFCFS